MPTGLDQAEANRLINAMTGKVTYPAATPPMMARLMTAIGSASANGAEVTNAGGSAYAPQSVTAATPAGGTNGVLASNAAITFTNMPAATETAIEIWDSGGTPRRAMFGSLTTAKTTALGDSLTLASGALSLSLNNTL